MTKHEKIELPEFMCDWLDIDRGPRHPLLLVKDLCDDRFDTHVVECWLNNNDERQWLLIDALRYGYVPEVERYVVPIFRYEDGKNEYEYLVIGFDGKPNTYLASAGETIKSIRESCKVELTLAEIKAINPRYDVFAVAVANWEGDGV